MTSSPPSGNTAPPVPIAPGIETRGDLTQMKENIIGRLKPEQIFLLSRAIDVLDVRESLTAYNIPSGWDIDNNAATVLLDIARDLWDAALWGELREQADDAQEGGGK